MGGSSSTRRVVVEETDGSGVVKISDSVVKRIRGLEDPGSQPAASSPPDSLSSYQWRASAAPTEKDVNALQELESFYVGRLKQLEERTTPARARMAFDKEETQWSQTASPRAVRPATPIDKEMQWTCELQKITNDQFIKAVQEVEQKFLKHTCSPVCQDLQAKVYECYCGNNNTTLNCSAEVRAFSTCVERARQNALLRRGQAA